MMTDEIWKKLMWYGKLLGCHQLAERSFFFAGYQFPICARCTGVLIAYVIAFILYFIAPIKWHWCIMGCSAMFFDWFIQSINIKQSTNIRRVITGFLGGYSLMTLSLYFFQEVFLIVKEW